MVRPIPTSSFIQLNDFCTCIRIYIIYINRKIVPFVRLGRLASLANYWHMRFIILTKFSVTRVCMVFANVLCQHKALRVLHFSAFHCRMTG